MILTQRERYIAISLGILLGLFASFEAIIKPYFDTRSAVADEIDSAIHEQEQNNYILAERAKLNREYTKMIADGLSDSQSEAKGQIRDALDQWTPACGVAAKTLADQQVTHEGDFDQIGFKLSGWGSTKNVAMLLNQCESTTLPLRVTKFVPTPVKEGQDYILFELTVSTIYRRSDANGGDRARLSAAAFSADMAKPTLVSTSSVQPLASPYKILLTRSIFAKDNRAAPEPPPRTNGWHKESTTQSTTAPVVLTPDPEADYVLRGVVSQDSVFIAMFEQMSISKGMEKTIGQTIARGQISRVSLDGVEYLLNGKSSHISIGQALDGHIADAPHSTSAPSTGGPDKPSWWGRHSSGETSAPAAPGAENPGSPPAGNESEGHRSREDRHSRDEHRSGDDHRPDEPNPKPPEQGPPGPPDDGPEPLIIVAPQ